VDPPILAQSALSGGLGVAAQLAPAAWLALVAVLLLGALARWYDAVPRRAALVFALLVALLYGRSLAGGAVLLPLDNLRGNVPFRELVPAEPHGNLLQGDLLVLIAPARAEARRALAAGGWPLWSPRMGGGLPLLADPQAQALEPVVLAAEGPLGGVRAPVSVAGLRTFLALVFTFLLLRRLGAGEGPALAGGVAYGLGGFLQLWVGWPLANTAALLPAVLYALVLGDERGERRDWTLLTLALAALLLAGHPETILYALAVTAAFAVARLRDRPRGRRLPWLARTLGALSLAAALAAPALLPFGEVLPHTLRWARLTGSAGPADVADVAGASETPEADHPGPAPATRLVQTAAPNALGNSRFNHYWGLRNTNEDAAGFVGTAALLAALLALPGWLAGGRPLRHELLGLGLAATAALALALPAGLAGVVPPLGAPGRLALVLDLGLVLAATGTFERLRRGSLPGWLRWAGPPIAALALVALHLWAYFALGKPGAPETLDILRWGWVHWHLRFAVLATLVLVLGTGRWWSAPALALALAAELFLAHGLANPPMPARLAFPETPPVTALREAVETAPTGARIAGVGQAFLPNLPAVYGLADARAVGPMTPAAYVRELQPAIARWSGETPELDGRDHPDLYDRLAIGWILAAPEAGCPEGTEVALADSAGLVCRRRGAPALLRLAGTPLEALTLSADGTRWSALVEPARGGRLETGVARLPGWRILADGVPVPVAGEGLLEAELPPHSRLLEALYRPAGFVAGLLTAALGLALLLAWVAPPPATTGFHHPEASQR